MRDSSDLFACSQTVTTNKTNPDVKAERCGLRRSCEKLLREEFVNCWLITLYLSGEENHQTEVEVEPKDESALSTSVPED